MNAFRAPVPDISTDLKERLTRVFVRFPGIEAVYLFGSAATGRAGPESDLDLAVVPARGAAIPKLEIVTALVAAGYDRVDLVSLDTDDVVLRFEAVRPNRLVYATAGFDHGQFFSRVVREYFDFEPYLRRQREALRQRLHGAQS